MGTTKGPGTIEEYNAQPGFRRDIIRIPMCYVQNPFDWIEFIDDEISFIWC